MQAAGGTAIDAQPANRPTAAAVWSIAIGIGLLGYGLDQLTKALALAHLDPANPPVLLGGALRLQLVHNPGAAFGMGEEFTVVITGIAVVALGFVLGWLLPRTRQLGWAVGLGMLLAGILGNLTDRLIRPPGIGHGHVVDFLQVPYFAIFNVADIFITFAAITIIWLVGIAGVDFTGERSRTGARKATA